MGEQKSTVDEWRIPFLNVLTGPIASIGAYLQWGADRAAEEINAAGGIAGKPVRIVRIDTGMESANGITEMSKLLDTALVVMGPVPEPVILAAVPLAAEEGIYSFTATTSYEYVADFYPWAISWYSPTEEPLPPIVTGWLKHTGGKRVVQFVENYSVWAGMAKAHEKGIRDAGAVVLNQVDVPTDAVSFGPLVVNALSQNPDSIIFSCNAQKIPSIIAELKTRGWNKMNSLLIFSSGDDAPLYTIGGTNINGIMIYNHTDPNLSNPRWDAFREAFKKEYNGIEPFSLSTNYYDVVYMIKRAIESTGITGDPKKLAAERILLRDYCNEIRDFEGIQFTWTNSRAYPRNKPIYLFEIQDGAKRKVLEIIPN
ncbi:ABC transporter substrate-binding protein [Treponema primitia]|uniref:ABC transporter substrate-binding protein n=1 Tax=Treponema primitia TaxID=88058 RepID=UPI0002D8351B|nr:ABC transporter substrate-binding protein [Treponema primitia]